MVRNYIRITDKGDAWTEDNMQTALNEIKSGAVSMRRASAKYGIPRTTLLSRISRGTVGPVVSMGRYRPVISSEMEEELKKHLIQLEKLFYGISTTDLRRLAYEFAESNGIVHPFDKNRRMAGKDWVRNFLKRQGDLSIRRPEATSLARVVGFSKEAVMRFFDQLKGLMDEFAFPAGNIFNCDECGISSVQKPGKIIARKGIKQVGRITSLERGKNVTLMACVSALGTFIPPFMVFPRARMNPQLLTGSLPGTKGFANPSGWMDASLFVKFLEHLISCTHPSKEKPILLILDGHCSHKSLEAIELARKSGIIMLTLPPHTTHKLQVLDVSVFGPFKNYMSQEIDLWMTNNPGNRVTDYDLAFIRACTPKNIISGFQSTGLYPLDTSVFDDSQFAASEHLRHDKEVNTDGVSKNSNSQDDNTGKNCNVELKDQVSEEPGPSAHVTIEKISPLPKKVENGSKKRKIQREQSEVITSTPYKKRVEEKSKGKANKPSNGSASMSVSKRVQKSKRKLELDEKPSSSSENSEKDTLCLYCSERYAETNLEEWIMCIKCKEWMHEDCTDNENGNDNFICDSCR